MRLLPQTNVEVSSIGASPLHSNLAVVAGARRNSNVDCLLRVAQPDRQLTRGSAMHFFQLERQFGFRFCPTRCARARPRSSSRFRAVSAHSSENGLEEVAEG